MKKSNLNGWGIPNPIAPLSLAKAREDLGAPEVSVKVSKPRQPNIRFYAFICYSKEGKFIELVENDATALFKRNARWRLPSIQNVSIGKGLYSGDPLYGFYWRRLLKEGDDVPEVLDDDIHRAYLARKKEIKDRLKKRTLENRSKRAKKKMMDKKSLEEARWLTRTSSTKKHKRFYGFARYSIAGELLEVIENSESVIYNANSRYRLSTLYTYSGGSGHKYHGYPCYGNFWRRVPSEDSKVPEILDDDGFYYYKNTYPTRYSEYLQLENETRGE